MQQDNSLDRGAVAEILLKEVWQNAPYGLEVVGEDGELFSINAAGEAMFDSSVPRQVPGSSWIDRWRQADRKIAHSALSAARDRALEIVVGWQDQIGDTHYFDVKITPVTGPPEGARRFLIFTRPCPTDRTIEEVLARSQIITRELRESEARFAALVNTMPQMVWSTQPDGFHDYYNARWYEFTGMPPGSTDGEGWNGMFHPEDQEKAWSRWRHSLETGEPYEIEYRLRHHSGEYRWTLGRALPVRDEEGRIVRWFGTCTEIHEAKTNAEMLGLLSQELSHRIKNIFAIVQGLIGMTAREAPEFRSVALTLRSRIAALGRAHDFARPHSEESRPVVGETTLHALLREILKPYPALQEGRITIIGDDIAIDDKAATPLAMIFHELATNAMKYGALSVPNGLVQIECRVSGEECSLSWQERNSTVTKPVSQAGFGTRLANVAVQHHLGGSLERIWGDEGLTVQITCSLKALHRRQPQGSGE